MTSEKVIEVVATSETSLEDAMLQGVEQAKSAIAKMGEAEAAGPLSDEAPRGPTRYTVTMHIDFEMEAIGDDEAMGDDELRAREVASDDRPEIGAMSPGDEVPPGTPGAGENICPTCGGSGEMRGRQCPTCAGKGFVVEAVGGA
jgi:flavin-binding protein dodecin